MRLKILGKWWALRFVPRLGPVDDPDLGDCDPPDTEHKVIRIVSSLTGEERLEILIHEMLHAACWWMAEEWVRIVAKDLARNLTRLGYKEDTDGK